MSWHDNAPCRGHTDAFFGHTVKEQRTARTLCASCPHIDKCRKEVLELSTHHRVFGYWAGMTQGNNEKQIVGQYKACHGATTMSLCTVEKRRDTPKITKNPNASHHNTDTPAKTQ